MSVRGLVGRIGADPVRLAAFGIIALTAATMLAVLAWRGDAAGVDAHAYWIGTRIWLEGGNPYRLDAPGLPYVYAPWALPLFVPWALLPFEVAFALWRTGTLLALTWSVLWAARRRPLSTAVAFALLSVPIGINLDTGNITLLLALALFAARFAGPRVAGVTWALATGMKWITAPFLLLLGRRARRWGLATLAATLIASLLLLPATTEQLRLIARLERPLPLDYLALAWAAVPWIWTDPTRRQWLRPRTWRGTLRALLRGERPSSVREGRASPSV